MAAPSTSAKHRTSTNITCQYSLGRPAESGSEALGLLVQRGVFLPSHKPCIFIMTPAIISLDTNENSRAILENGDNDQRYPQHIGQISAALGQMLPDVPIGTFVYRRQTINNYLRGASGKAMVCASGLAPS